MNTARVVRTIFTEAGAVLQNTENGATFTINPMGAHIWRHLTKGVTKDDIVDRVSTDFGVEREQVCRDVEEFLLGLEQKGLLHKNSDKEANNTHVGSNHFDFPIRKK
jgi:hypothetical protein